MTEILRYLELVELAAYPDEETFVQPPQAVGRFYNIASSSLDVPGDTDIQVDSAFGRSELY